MANSQTITIGRGEDFGTGVPDRGGLGSAVEDSSLDNLARPRGAERWRRADWIAAYITEVGESRNGCYEWWGGDGNPSGGGSG